VYDPQYPQSSGGFVGNQGATNRIGNGIEQRLLADVDTVPVCGQEVMSIQGLAHQRF